MPLTVVDSSIGRIGDAVGNKVEVTVIENDIKHLAIIERNEFATLGILVNQCPHLDKIAVKIIHGKIAHRYRSVFGVVESK